jgi:hypothetical protein
MTSQTDDKQSADVACIPKDVLSDLQDIVNYLLYDELEHCRANNDSLVHAPLLPALVNVKGWLEGLPRDLNWWLRYG